MKKQFCKFLAVSLIALVFSCKSKEKVIPYLSVKETSIDLSENLEFTLDVTANIPIVFAMPAWIHEKEGNTPVIGRKPYYFQAVALPEGVDSRTGDMVVKPENASIDISVTVPVEQNNFTSQFTIPVFPDTQYQSSEVLFSACEWIASNSRQIPIVLHVGDIVDIDRLSDWQRASAGMTILDNAHVPYAIAVGNHDTAAATITGGASWTNTNLRNTTNFNNYFPVSRFTLQKGRFETNKSDNAYYTFEVGGYKWIVVTLEFCARESAVQWMDQTLKLFPDHNAIILTHYHLNTNGTIGTTNDSYGNMNPAYIFNGYIKPNKNVLMVLCGHVCDGNTSAWRIDKDSHDNNIYQILQNFQCSENDSFLRLLDFDMKNKTITAKMYSPYLNVTLDNDSKFTFKFEDVDFIKF